MTEDFLLHWDADMHTDQDVIIVIYAQSVSDESDVARWSIYDNVSVQHMLDSFYLDRVLTKQYCCLLYHRAALKRNVTAIPLPVLK